MTGEKGCLLWKRIFFYNKMTITATEINYYILCKRKLWLFANQIQMETTSEIVADGKLLHETSYPQRNEKHTEFTLTASYNGINLVGKIDFYDSSRNMIHETKRSNKMERTHEWQAKFYLWLLKLNGIQNATAKLEYPLIRQTDTLALSEPDIHSLEHILQQISLLKKSEICPPVINSRICKSCSYYELCYIAEV